MTKIKYLILIVIFLSGSLCTDKISIVKGQTERKLCSLHKKKLLVDKVEITYGLAMIIPNPEKVKDKLFPYANTYVLGGCVYGSDSARYTEVFYCKTCRKAYEKWRNQQLKPTYQK